MKRTLATPSLCPTLPVEIWCRIIDGLCLLDDIGTISAIFLIDKAVCHYLSVHSCIVRDLIMVTHLNRRYMKSAWFLCNRCDRLCIDERPRFEGRKPDSTFNTGVSLSGNYCRHCMIPCPQCTRHVLRDRLYCSCGYGQFEIDDDDWTDSYDVASHHEEIVDEV